jgi:hypothetical protein
MSAKDPKTQLMRKLKSLKVRIYYEREGLIQSDVFSGKSELAILLDLQGRGISTKHIRRVEALK